MKKLTILLLTLVCLHARAQITTYNINRNISCTETFCPFGSNTRSYGISIDGEGQLLSDSAFIRVVLVDNDDNEWLIYERNSLYATEENTQFQGAAFETSALYDIAPKHLIVTLCDASLYLANVKSNRTAKDRNTVAAMADSVFLSKNLQIVERINTKLSAHKKAWRADTTFLSNLRYQERKAMFGNDLPNLQGWDYYKYGYYSPLNDNTPQASDNIVKEFDWRTRHGSQNSDSYYYNHHGSGWIPKRRYGQGNSECWAFSVLYSTEALVNLYFNQQINDELSVQDIVSCSGGSPGYGYGGSPTAAMEYVIQEGVVDDACMPYISWREVFCDEKCSNPYEKVIIGGRSSVLYGEDNIKREIITKGVLVSVVNKWGHAMSMVGFGVVKAGDPILYGNFNIGTDYNLYVEEDSPDIGKPYYIFKQSYANYGYDRNPFCNIIIDANYNSHVFSPPYENLNYYLWAFSINTPIISLLYDDSDIDCADNDGDGYYNWGIGPKPAHCPNCPDEEDSDDSSPLIGPYNEKYESVVLCDNYVYSPIPEYITTPIIWGSEKYLDHDVVVENGGVLTVKNTMYMGESTKIIVKPGGKLILDYRAVLTGLCGNMWSGIEVWGNSAAHQYPVNGHYAQGYVELKNGATIENAECALALWRPNHWGTTGGIVHAENATFRNCAKAVHALHYANHHPATGKETAYNSRFRNCTFAIDNGYLGTTAFHKHADLNHVDGIGFIGCDFSADRTAANVSPWCIGIAAYTSGFKATSFCDYNGSNSGIHPCPDELVKGCSFSGFHEGIFANNDGSAARTFLVSNGSFRNNRYGIHALNTGFATILHSDFVVGSGNECAFGIHADHVAGFCIEENSFRAQHNGTGDTYGIAISDSHGTNDIYRNTFSGLACGNLAVGTNIADGLPVENRRTMTGLTYTCNENEGNGIDFCVLDGGAHPSGIQEHQGSLSLPAGNTFSGRLYHFYNEGDDLLTYYYFNGGQPGQEPAGGLLYRVTHEPSPNANDCPSHYGNGGPVLSEEERAAACDNYFLSHTAYESLERVYGNRLDGGNTAAQTAHIEAATPADMWQLRTQLLSRSPYLSQEVLTAAADRDDVFPEMAQFEILAANPDELKKDTLIRYLENKDNPLPPHMTDLLRVLAEGTTDRTVLMAQMGRMGRDFSLAAADIVRSNLNDSVADPDELRTWLANMECLDADRLAVASLVQEGDFSNALALAGSLPQLYGMQDGSLDEHDDYMLLLGLYQSLHDSNRNASELDAAEVETVEGIAEQGRGAAKAMAKSLLRGLSDDRVPSIDCPRLPDAGNGGRGGTKPVDASLLGMAMGLDASVRPNPATSWAVIDYTLPLGATKATLTFTNALGVAVMTAELNGSQGQKVLDLRPLAAGVYGYDVRCGEYVLNGKMVVTK